MISSDNYVKACKAVGLDNETVLQKAFALYKPSHGIIPIQEYIDDWVVFITNDDPSKPDCQIHTSSDFVSNKNTATKTTTMTTKATPMQTRTTPTTTTKTTITPETTTPMPMKTPILTPEKTTPMPTKTVITPEKTTPMPTKTVITPEKTIPMPTKTTITPEKTSITPKKATITPEKTTITPEKTIITPEKTIPILTKTTITPEKTTPMPTKTTPVVSGIEFLKEKWNIHLDGKMADAKIEAWWENYILKGNNKITKADLLKDLEKGYTENKKNFVAKMKALCEDIICILDTDKTKMISLDNYVKAYKVFGHDNEALLRKAFELYKPSHGMVPLQEYIEDWLLFLTNDDPSKTDVVYETYKAGLV
ncbi:unnamed protein product [Mytilus coruscus]|uniref:EF-hand domain-containing protein n=1 Tax=Mytilus coruscus TaxID=42192 RepID=A0A6J8DFS2_MYTCO|nr:unnamed protein product [Mytilus coruscus]